MDNKNNGANLLRALLAAGFLFLAAGATRAADEASTPKPIPWPTLRIPKLAKAPVIDGRIDPEEWKDAAAITGFHPVYLDEIRCQWYVAYDDEWLYFAMHSPLFAGTWPAAKGKPSPDGDASLGWDAHAEIELSNQPREKAYQKGFYIIHVNPRDAVMDQHYNFNPGQAGMEWQCERKMKSTVREGLWDMELALKRSSLTDKPFDNTEWVMHLVRADGFSGAYFFAWKYSWYVNCHEFPAAIFDPAAPSFRFLRLGEIRKGDMDIGLELVGRGKPQTVDLSVRALDAQRKPLLEKTQQVTLGPDERKSVSFKDTLRYPEKGTADVEIRAYLTSGGGRVPLYEQRIPALGPWTAADDQARREEIARRLTLVNSMNGGAAYFPSVSTIRVFVDNEVVGMPDRITRCRDLRAAVRDKAAPGKPIAQAAGKIDPATLGSDFGIPLPDLSNGEYEVVMELINPEGKVEDTKTVPFARRKYPWEGNAIGKDKVVIPPFTPLVVEGNRIRPWGRTYTIGKSGLPASIVHTGDELLADPIRLEATEGGKAVELAGSALKVQPADNVGHTVVVEAEGTLGSLPMAVHGVMEYDGFYLVTLDMKPAAPVTLDRLDLVIPLWEAADLALVKRGDGLHGSYMGAFPRGDGAVWDSRMLGKYGSWGSFAPIVFAGTGDKALMWEAEAMDGWNADAESACVVLERRGGMPQVRIRMFHKPTVVDKPRAIRFALRAVPTKPMKQNWRGIAWRYPSEQLALSSNLGYRWYGDGVNSFTLPRDEDFLGLRKVYAAPWPIDESMKSRRYCTVGGEPFRQGKPLILYGSNMGAGMAMKELETYCGEWLGGPWPENPAPEAQKGDWNQQETLQWNEPRQLCAAFVNVCDSYMDCYLWNYQKYVALSGVQGTWWDNGSVFTVCSPEKGTGQPIYRWNVFQRREFIKRLATMCWQAGKEPYWEEGMGLEVSFNSLNWLIENDFYLPSDTTFYEYLPMDTLRALTSVRRGLITSLYPQGTGTTPEKQELMTRSADGIRLLHDIGCYHGAGTDGRLPGLLQGHVGFFDDADSIEFVGYWRSAPYAQFRPQDPKAPLPYMSIYRNRKSDRALVVVANASAQPIQGTLWLNRGLLLPNRLLTGNQGLWLMDIESGKSLGGNYDNRGDWYDRFQWNDKEKRYETDLFTLPAYNHRLLVLR